MSATRLTAARTAVLVTTLVTLLGVVVTGFVRVAPASSASTLPVEAYASYQAQTKCSPTAKAGMLLLSKWIVKKYGGGNGGISRACSIGGASEHKEGRAFDWNLDYHKAADRARAKRFMKAIFATGPSGQRAELARRMGIMYVIWNDRLYGSYRQFAGHSYLNAGCTSIKTCSDVLRHRTHMHISLTRAGGAGKTSWFVGRLKGVTIKATATKKATKKATPKVTKKATAKPTPKVTKKATPTPTAKATKTATPTPTPTPTPTATATATSDPWDGGSHHHHHHRGGGGW